MTLPIVSEVTVSRRSTKRFFDIEFKRRVMAEYDALPPYSTERGSLLRREGLHTRQVHEWRRTAVMKNDSGTPKRRGRPPKQTADGVEIERLLARTVRLEAELVKKDKVIEIMGKAHALLDALSQSADTTPKPPKS
jgi:transposase